MQQRERKTKTGLVTRRGFIGTMAGVLAAPYFIPARALGRDGAIAPSERIAIGAIGVGGRGQQVLSAFAGDSGCQIIAIADVDKKMRDKTLHMVNAKNGNNAVVTGDFREVVSRADIDAVIIATPEHWHAIISLSAMRAGKDVYCEKPLTWTLAEGRVVADTAKRYGRVFQTGSQHRSEGGFRQSCEMVRSGRIGDLEEVWVNTPGPPVPCDLPGEATPEGLDWDMWCGPGPYRAFNRRLHPYSWRPYKDWSAGQTANWGAHWFDIAQWGMGTDHTGPVEVIPPTKPGELLTFVYASGVRLYHGGKDNVKFVGTKGSIVGGKPVADKPELTREPLRPDEVHLYESKNHKDNWLDAIRTRRETVCPAEIGHRSVTLSHLCNIGYFLRRPLKWDPVKEEFVNDAEANTFLDRPRRAPWRI